jgi:hypothetical protein
VGGALSVAQAKKTAMKANKTLRFFNMVAV